MFRQRIIVKNVFFVFVSSTKILLFCCHIVFYIIGKDIHLAI